ncbi:unnamed protein product [Effrenium voratum]|uniref:C3H1-type domain-containing protein n=1 Tax=Effrenium voratum TaxID=2562239 RepID=A0AA36I3N7_9DINO|nr:unnamed protein product [Effrenium voratum]CAJ1380466.1 unnamed protein product [Effrenium voratum]CAJ1429699.1 unnamed protein product [Effrenium voratum]|mmetsp:Transcript_25435/g.60629  ORF Transcript_25435/g.60629 Transcript_25435/m.60629 type:complete len:221 (-) Transcript_25435:107-769(-)
MRAVFDPDLLKRDLEAKLQRLIEEERQAQSRERDGHPYHALSFQIPCQAGEVLPSELVPVHQRCSAGTPSFDPLAALMEPPPSLGTRGHPNRCKPACRFFRRRGGCRDGVNCKFCHECVVSEPEPSYIGMAACKHGSAFTAPSGPVPPGAMKRPAALEEYPSEGSKGHPLTCAPACKYNSKSKGCKDGANCDHCHLCRWRRHASGSSGGGYTLDTHTTFV